MKINGSSVDDWVEHLKGAEVFILGKEYQQVGCEVRISEFKSEFSRHVGKVTFSINLQTKESLENVNKEA